MHPKTIQRYIREGKLRANKIGKSWRISGHDLSVFTEQTGQMPNGTADRPREQARASAVIDLDLADNQQAMRLISSLTAALNVKPPEFGHPTLYAQHLESEGTVRITLWGNLKFMEAMMSSINTLAEQLGEE
jgi:excisionase family DNA binding protein